MSDPEQWRKIAEYLRRQQQPEGYWAQYYDGPGELSTSVEAYFALKLAGEDPNAPHMQRAREWILAQGGIARARVFTKLWLALFGEYDWDRLPALPAWINLLPKWFPVNVYEFASWARATVVGITVIFALRPTATVPAGAGVQELWLHAEERRQLAVPRPRKPLSWASFFYTLDQVLRFLDRNHVRPFQRRALAAAERWLLERQEADGSWGGIQPPWVYAILALRAQGYPLDHPAVRRALQGFQRFTWEADGMLWTESCQSPVWDTGLAVMALVDAGVPADDPALRRAGQWLLNEQVLTGGDWQVKNPDGPPGGWAFEFDTDIYPDVDDAAIVLTALHDLDLADEESKQRAADLGLRWMVSMQSDNGGWAAFDVNNTKSFLTQIPFADFGELLDPPTADVTAHALELLGRLGYQGDYPPAQRALEFLYALQEPDGSWWGRWGVNYIYGLGSVLPALASLGESMSQTAVRSAVHWLLRHQLPDGGWGESANTYAQPSLRGSGPSTPSQTAWAVMALIAAGETESESVARGVAYLVERETSDGTWDEPQFTGTGFPTDFMIQLPPLPAVLPLDGAGSLSARPRGALTAVALRTWRLGGGSLQSSRAVPTADCAMARKA